MVLVVSFLTVHLASLEPAPSCSSHNSLLPPVCSDLVAPSSTFCMVFTLMPFLTNNREKRLSLDNKLKHQETNLESRPLLPPDPMLCHPDGP